MILKEYYLYKLVNNLTISIHIIPYKLYDKYYMLEEIY